MTRAFLTGVVVGVEVPDATVVVMVVDTESVLDGVNGKGRRYMWSTMISTAENLSDHLPRL